jgi:hypothetical protein
MNFYKNKKINSILIFIQKYPEHVVQPAGHFRHVFPFEYSPGEHPLTVQSANNGPVQIFDEQEGSQGAENKRVFPYFKVVFCYG